MRNLVEIFFIIIFLFSLSIILLFATGVINTEGSGETIEEEKFSIFIPDNIEKNDKYPLVVALSPTGNRNEIINIWKAVSKRNNIIVLASKEFRNKINPNPIFKNISSKIYKMSNEYPIDRKKIIITGFSGGGMGSHMFAYSYPYQTSAIVVNTGMMNKYFKRHKSTYPTNKVAVFLASPTDFRYDDMKSDKIFLESIGWKVKWIEFQGGHKIAPKKEYKEAANWILNQL